MAELEEAEAALRRRQEAPKESEELLHSIMEQSPIAVQTMTPGDRIVQVNDAYVKLCGITLKHLGEYKILKDEQANALGLTPLH
jgi:PAS domain-containing protein